MTAPPRPRYKSRRHIALQRKGQHRTVTPSQEVLAARRLGLPAAGMPNEHRDYKRQHITRAQMALPGPPTSRRGYPPGAW